MSLEGLRVVVTRPADKAAELGGLLEDRGAIPLHVPTIAIADPSSWAGLDQALERTRDGAYEWLVFTSVNAVEKTLQRLGATANLGTTKIAAVGSATRAALNERGIEVDLVPQEYTGKALAAALGPGGGRVLLPRVEQGPRSTVEALKERGWGVDEVVAYRNVVLEPSSDLNRDDFDVVTFASASAARNFAAVFDVDDLGLTPHAREKVVACIGPSTGRAAASVGLRVDVTASTHTDEGLVAALEEHVASHPVI